jgi:transmembrane sensor
MRNDPRLPPALADAATKAAAGWALEAEHGLTAARARQLDAWLAADPAHAPALAAAQDALAILAAHAADAEIMALRRAALTARPEPLARYRPPLAAVAAVLMLALPVGGWLLSERGQPVAEATATLAETDRYATAVGERSTITLPDGSVMVLNTASQAEVAYSESARTVRLLRGQALFTVAHGRPAPFRVEAGDRTITAVGTIFDVRMDAARVQVSMLEGTVRVEARLPTAAVPQVETLSAGEVLVAAPREPVRVRTDDVGTLTSWREGLITFKDTPLSEAVAEINRYAGRPILLADGATGRHRLSGTFRVGDPQRFARLMTELFPLEMGRTKEGNPILKPKAL